MCTFSHFVSHALIGHGLPLSLACIKGEDACIPVHLIKNLTLFFVCFHCHHIVANSHSLSHSNKCSGSVAGAGSSQVSVASTPDRRTVMYLVMMSPSHPLRTWSFTVCTVPQLVTCLKTRDHQLFMLPNSVLWASHRSGQRHKPHFIEELHRRWSDGHLTSLLGKACKSSDIFKYCTQHFGDMEFAPAETP